MSCELFVLTCAELRVRHPGQRHCRRRPEIVPARRFAPRATTGKTFALSGGATFAYQILAPGRCPETPFRFFLAYKGGPLFGPARGRKLTPISAWKNVKTFGHSVKETVPRRDVAYALVLPLAPMFSGRS